MAWEPPILESQLQFCPGDQGRWEQPADVRQAALNFSTALQSAPARLGVVGRELVRRVKPPILNRFRYGSSTMM